jgi:amino acid transporter
VLVPLTIVLTVFVAIYFFVVFIASTYMLTLSRSLMLYMIFITTALMYFVTMYYDIKIWHYKQVHKPTRTAQRYRKTLTKPAL